LLEAEVVMVVVVMVVVVQEWCVVKGPPTESTHLSGTTTLRSRTGNVQSAARFEFWQLRQGVSPEHLILCEWQRWQAT